MAHETGVAANFEDLFSRILAFLTTNPTLVADGDQWEALRVRRDRLAALTSNLPGATNAQRQIQHCFRYDPRSLGSNDPGNANTGYYNTTTGFTPGVSFIACRLRTATEIRTLRLMAATTNDNQYMIRTFRLQYSDDGAAWTTALTQASTAVVYETSETKDWAVPASGAHLHWRVLIDSVQNGFSGRVAFTQLLMLDAEGEVANHFGSDAIFKARGSGGADAIYTGIRAEYDASSGWFNLFLNGYTGYDANEKSWFKQPGAIPHFTSGAELKDVPMVPCWDAPMAYWFAANGRSFRFGVKVSTSYECGYLGLILPYATPGQYPYPLAVGGSMVPVSATRGAEWRYSFQGSRHSAFVIPGVGATPDTVNEAVSTTLYLRLPDGTWGFVGNRLVDDRLQGMTQSLTPPYALTGSKRAVWPFSTFDQPTRGKLIWRECLGGGYALFPCVIHQRLPVPAVWGELEGCLAISGFANGAENTASFGGKEHVVFPNATRSSVSDFWAMALD